MNVTICQQALDGVGSGVAASLYAVDCAASATAQTAFGRLFGTDGALLPALTILLTLFIAFFAFALITGRSRLGVASLTPRMMTLGLVLTFATSWAAYQATVWNIAVGAPNQIASILMGTQGSATDIFAQKIDIVFAALIEAGGQQTTQEAPSTFSPPGLMWLGGVLLLLGTVGVLATAKIALAVLLALGPIFVVLALFASTRGLFVGWLKSVVMLALAPLLAVLGGSLMLELAVPVLRGMAQVPGQIDARAAMAFFMIGSVHCALMVLVLKVAGTMVAGWTVFGLSAGAAEREARAAQAAAPVAQAAAVAALATDPARAAAAPFSREIRLAQAAPAAANDTGPSAGSRREVRLAPGQPSPGVSHAANASLSRSRGVGSRFRAPQVRTMEKFK